jgi:hypothetical protein
MGVRQKRYSALLAPRPAGEASSTNSSFGRNSNWKLLILSRSTGSSKKFTLRFEVGVATVCNLLLPLAQLRAIAGGFSRSKPDVSARRSDGAQEPRFFKNEQSRTLAESVNGTNWRKKARKCDEMVTVSCNSCNQWTSLLVTVSTGRTSLRIYSV